MKRTPLRKKSKVRNNEWYRKKCVTLAKLIVRHRAKYKCAKCGQGEPLKQTHGAHIFSEGTHHSMSADMDNIICLCASHHNWGKESWHDNPVEMIEWLREYYGEKYEELRIRARGTYKVDFQKKLEELKQIWNEISNG